MGNEKDMNPGIAWGRIAALVLLAAAGILAQGGAGPGIPKVTFAPEEVGKRIFIWTNLVGRVPKALMFQGYLLVFQNRSRQISAFDFANPKAPRPVTPSIPRAGETSMWCPPPGPG